MAPLHGAKNAEEAVYHAVVLEEVAKMAFAASLMKEYGGKSHMQQELLDKHFLRKHGKNAYYGQEGGH